MEGKSLTPASLTEQFYSDDTGRRLWSLTERGMGMYNETNDKFQVKLRRAQADIDSIMSVLESKDSNPSSKQLQAQLTKCYDEYCTINSEYFQFLSRTGTNQSLERAEAHSQLTTFYKGKVEAAFRQLNELRDQAVETGSQRSSASLRTRSRVSSSSSRLSTLLAEKRAAADAARVRAEFAKMEANLHKQEALLEADLARQKAELKADLCVLEQRREAAAIEAEVRALEEAEEKPRILEMDAVKSLSASDRVESYIKQQQELTRNLADPFEANIHSVKLEKCSHKEPVMDVDFPSDAKEFERATDSARPALLFSNGPMLSHAHPKDIESNVQTIVSPTQKLGVEELAPNPDIQKRNVHTESPSQKSGNTMAVDLTRFLLKKDLLLSRLSSFNDKPEVYAVWKASFKNIITDLQVTAFEELDLLVKWLGPESSRYAVSIRNSNANDPQRGLDRIWERLEERYGSPEMVEFAIKTKLARFPKLTMKDDKKFYELADIVSEIESAKDNQSYRTLLAYYDSSSGVLPIINKLPHGLQQKWAFRATEYKRKHGVSFPPFSFLCNFVREISRMKNDPGFVFEADTDRQLHKKAPSAQSARQNHKYTVNVKKTQTKDMESKTDDLCPLHHTKHSLNDCRAFKTKPLHERKKLLKDNNLCFKCVSDKHSYRMCKRIVRCGDCGSDSHVTAMHVSANPQLEVTQHGGERKTIEGSTSQAVTSKCTQICSDGFSGKSCSKTVLVKVYREGHSEEAFKTYAILDDQSNRTLARSEFFTRLGADEEEIEYSLSSCNGRVMASGRRMSGVIVESLDGNSRMELPTVIECDQLPDLRDEIPTPGVARHHTHLQDISEYIPPVDNNAVILLLIGRDLIEAHHVLDQRIGPKDSPYAQRLRLGWVIIGEACLGSTHRTDFVRVNKIQVLSSGRPSVLPPCPFVFKVKEEDSIGDSVFQRTKDDNKLGVSVDDRKFLDIMERQFQREPGGLWTAPLPFRAPRQRLPNNRVQALKRAKILDSSIRKDETKKKHFIDFMQKIFDKGHAELAPPMDEGEERWYLPIFGVYHPKKPDQIRAVFDSSAKFEGVSLNSVLLSGPDLTNSLLGVLIRFRREPVAIVADIQQMFYCFSVKQEHRNYLRFLWYKDNDLQNDLVEYRMCVHVFGNSPSPAVATYGLRKIARISEDVYGSDVVEFVSRDFYVDDGLTSRPTVQEAIDLMKRTQDALQQGGQLRLHKIASNREEVMKAFPTDDLASDLKELDMGKDNLPVQRSLGLSWSLASDSFSFNVSLEQKPFTRRGALSTINSIFDPLGFVAPVTIKGKLLLRDFMIDVSDWDQPLPEARQEEWNAWRDSLRCLKELQIPRTYISDSLAQAVRCELHVFADASEKAIAAVSYLRAFYADGNVKIGFILGKTKVAPSHGHTIPRLELCAAVLASELSQTVVDSLDYQLNEIQFYTDSKVVLGYINNTTRRFLVYVSNRVECIRRVSSPDQWTYVPTHLNPADCGTRGVPASVIQQSPWLLGPDRLKLNSTSSPQSYPLVDPDRDKEIRPEVQVVKTTVVGRHSLGSNRFSRFSCWNNLVNAIALLRRFLKSRYKCISSSEQMHHLERASRPAEAHHEAERFIIQVVQYESFPEEVACIRESRPLPKNSSIIALNPVIDEHGLLRVGGRLNRGPLCSSDRNPLIIPKTSHIAILLIRYFHDKVKHQGRQFTEGAIRSAGLWVIGGKRLISSLIQKCVLCRKLRRRLEIQKMSDLPLDRLVPGPPFSSVGVDAFGPWSVVARRTRGGQASSKRWAILFTCLTSRAIHIEVIEEMSTSCFINALRRFVSIRGPVKELRSDCGTNFVGSTEHLKIDAIGVEQGPVKDFLRRQRTTWIFNSPHSSHMGGVWERMIGTTRRIFDSMMMGITPRNLTHEVLTTFMAEVCAIVNARPIVPVSSDPESPEILSPSMLLTQKMHTVGDPFECVQPCSKDMFKAQWKQVQLLADTFWKRWRCEYLNTLQGRRKWHLEQPNVKAGDVVLLREKDAHRNEWPVGVVNKVFPSEDGLVRKTEIRVLRGGKLVVYMRPVSELVVLLSE